MCDTDDKVKARREQMWQAVLTEAARLEWEECGAERGGGTSRSAAWWSQDGRVATRLDVGMRDGTHRVFFIQATDSRPPWRDPQPNDPIRIQVERSYHSAESYWEDLIAQDADGLGVVVDGVHYRLGPNGDRPSPHNGFGGHRKVVEFLDGRQVVTHDLWYQGPVPPKFLDRLPDNARWAEETVPA